MCIMNTMYLVGKSGVRRFPRHKKNLALVVESNGEFYIRSYSTLVARVEGDTLVELGKWSVTTSRHVGYAARYLGLKRVKGY